jgi:type IV pilus assembly protein PilW
MTIHLHHGRTSQNGAGIVETMIGILIGMIVILVVYNVFAVSEGYKRAAVGAADAQTTGLYAQFVLAREITNAGNGLLDSGIASSVSDLVQCANKQATWSNPKPFPNPGVPAPIRPTPVLINDGGGVNAPDSLIVAYSLALHVVSPVQFVDPPATGTGPLYVQSPNGFQANDRVIAINPRDPVTNSPDCELSVVTAVVPGDAGGDATTGIVGLTLSKTYPLAKTYTAGAPPDGSKLLNLGQQSEVARTLYDIVNGQLRSTDLLTAGATANPIAQNVVLLKAQYGIDCGGNGVVTWTSATNNDLCGDGITYTPDDVTAFNGPTLARLRAVRIGIVVRSDEPDLKDKTLTGQKAVLFNCSTGACQGSISLDNAILTDYYRFRTYETVIPMRNAIWNTGT